MWFSPGSIVFGALRSLWDAAKVLDLPPEVTDAPWVPHKVGCPHCHKSQWVLPGPIACAHSARCKGVSQIRGPGAIRFSASGE
jgi:hypothetical protein